jgi:RHS repeat-associated protein
LLWVGGAGYYADDETALAYVRRRTFSTPTGHWQSVDPQRYAVPRVSADIAALTTPYLYVANAPVLSVDPSGRELRFEPEIGEGEGRGADKGIPEAGERNNFGYTYLDITTLDEPTFAYGERDSTKGKECCHYYECGILRDRVIEASITWYYVRAGTTLTWQIEDQKVRAKVGNLTEAEAKWHEPVHAKLNRKATEMWYDGYYVESLSGASGKACDPQEACKTIKDYESRVYAAFKKGLEPRFGPVPVRPANLFFHNGVYAAMDAYRTSRPGSGRDPAGPYFQWFHRPNTYTLDMETLYAKITPPKKPDTLTSREPPCCKCDA